MNPVQCLQGSELLPDIQLYFKWSKLVFSCLCYTFAYFTIRYAIDWFLICPVALNVSLLIALTLFVCLDRLVGAFFLNQWPECLFCEAFEYRVRLFVVCQTSLLSLFLLIIVVITGFRSEYFPWGLSSATKAVIHQSRVVAHQGWVVICSSRAPDFGRST